MEYTAIVQKTDDGWYVAQCEQIPAAITQGRTLEELDENLKDAISLILEVEKEDALKRFSGTKVFRRNLQMA
ncbi:MAG: type II toxin-antitoxin system HicB family antitoxin [Tannerella sp.]|jgi:predicted RNase H-like HicB family nuclease|nr:type II toxin-antitoxin system HicB family antitoxin [Tannerella sp.]